MREPRSQLLEGGAFLVCAVLPLAVFPPGGLPFADAKPLILTLGVLLMWVSGVRPDPRLALPVAALAGALVAASAAGIDPLESLYGTARPTGLVMLLPAVALAAMGPSIPDDLLERMRRWIVVAAVVAAVLALLEHVAPSMLDVVLDQERFSGGTFGNPVVLAGFLALGVTAAFRPKTLGAGRVPVWVTLAVLGSAFGVIGERSAFLLPVVALAAAWFAGRVRRRALATAAAALLVGIVVWSFVPHVGGATSSSAVASQFETTLGERQRLAVASANLRAATERPVLGWGPSNAWSAFLSAGTRDEIRTATRTWGDAHDLFIQFAVTTGVVGLAALLWLGARIVRRVEHRASERSWALAGAITLFAFSLYEPLDPTLTPLLFLLAGAAVARAPQRANEPPPVSPGRRTPARTAAAIGGATVLAMLVVVAALSLASSTLEEWGRLHAGSRWALEGARTLAPWRLTAVETLAIDLALDARSGDAAAGAEARRVVTDAIADHPDHPGLRLVAVDVEILLRDETAARAWLDRHLERFPNDTVRSVEGRPQGASDPLAA